LRTKDSSNSSKPPSSDGPAAKPKARPPKKSKKRKRGALPGRKGNNRDLIPIDEVDAVEEIVHAACEGCHEALTSSTNPEEGKYLRSQVVDIPETTLHVTEYRLPRVGCDCAAETWAELPSQRSVWIRPSSHGFCRASDRCSPSHRTRRGWHEILNPKIRGHHTQLA
jgi:transposase